MRSLVVLMLASVALSAELPDVLLRWRNGDTETLRVLNQFPHDRAAFTQGFEFRDGIIYESTGLYGQSTLRKVDLESGTVLHSTAYDSSYFGEGLTVWDEKIFALTWKARKGFVFDRELQQTGLWPYDTEGWGLTHNDTHLVLSDGSDKLYFIDPETFSVDRTLSVTDEGRMLSRLNELELIDDRVWSNVWFDQRVALISQIDGRVDAWLDLSPVAQLVGADSRRVVNGIAFDAEQRRLFVTGKLWPSVFEVEMPSTGLD